MKKMLVTFLAALVLSGRYAQANSELEENISLMQNLDA